MPNYTTKYGFPSPKPTEGADGPTGFQQLAQKVEDVLFAQFGKVTPGTTTEILLRGATAPGDPLLADLRGTRSGNWNVTGSETVGTTITAGTGITATSGAITAGAGDLIAGKTGVTSSRIIRAIQTISGETKETRLYNSSGGDAALAVFWGSTYRAIMYLGENGQVSVTCGQSRPVPFAFQAGAFTLTFTSDAARLTTVNFITSRFTRAPVCTSTPTGGSSFYAYQGTPTAASAGFGAYQRDGASITGTIDINWIAIQALATAGEGRASDLSADQRLIDEHDVAITDVPTVCVTVGCPNYSVEILSRVYTNDDYPVPDVVCGGCGQRAEIRSR